MSKRWLILILMSALGSALSAGDVASFVNLGFSPDGAYFQFGQYGVEGGGEAVYAEIYTVDNARNAFVAGGNLKATSYAALDTGQDGSGAFFNLLYENRTIARARGIDHLRQGRLLYILMNGEEARSDISFRDFKTGDEYRIVLNPSVLESEDVVVSSFSLDLSLVSADGRTRTIHGGSPSVRREGVSGYLVRRVILSPEGRNLVVVVEKKLKAKDGSSIRYMVETFKLK